MSRKSSGEVRGFGGYGDNVMIFRRLQILYFGAVRFGQEGMLLGPRL